MHVAELARWWSEAQDHARPQIAARAVLDYVKDNDGASLHEIRELMTDQGVEPALHLAILSTLVSQGRLREGHDDGYSLGEGDGDGDPAPARLSMVRLATHHAPAGGVTIGGVEYVGGQFIPEEAIASATEEEKDNLEGLPTYDWEGVSKAGGADFNQRMDRIKDKADELDLDGQAIIDEIHKGYHESLKDNPSVTPMQVLDAVIDEVYGSKLPDEEDDEDEDEDDYDEEEASLEWAAYDAEMGEHREETKRLQAEYDAEVERVAADNAKLQAEYDAARAKFDAGDEDRTARKDAVEATDDMVTEATDNELWTPESADPATSPHDDNFTEDYDVGREAVKDWTTRLLSQYDAAIVDLLPKQLEGIGANKEEIETFQGVVQEQRGTFKEKIDAYQVAADAFFTAEEEYFSTLPEGVDLGELPDEPEEPDFSDEAYDILESSEEEAAPDESDYDTFDEWDTATAEWQKTSPTWKRFEETLDKWEAAHAVWDKLTDQLTELEEAKNEAEQAANDARAEVETAYDDAKSAINAIIQDDIKPRILADIDTEEEEDEEPDEPEYEDEPDIDDVEFPDEPDEPEMRRPGDEPVQMSLNPGEQYFSAPPGPGWQFVRAGTRGGHVYKAIGHQGGQQQPTPQQFQNPAQPPQAGQQPAQAQQPVIPGGPVQPPVAAAPGAAPAPQPDPAAAKEAAKQAAIEDYKQNGVKAKAFKAWFGDWEADPANSSHVVDWQTGRPQETHKLSNSAVPAGKPAIYFHGTRGGKFNKFDKSKLRNADNLNFGPGFYFTPQKEVAERYLADDKTQGQQGGADPHLFEVYLNIRNEFNIDKRYSRQEFEKYTGKKVGLFKRLNRFMNQMPGHYSGEEVYSAMAAVHGGRTGANKRLQQLGHDGIFTDNLNGNKGERCMVALEANQVKSKDNQGTFDPNEEDIRMSLEGASWVRYEGPKHGHGWKSTKTGVVIYQDEMPGEHKHGEQEGKSASKSSEEVAKAAKMVLEPPGSITAQLMYGNEEQIGVDKAIHSVTNARGRKWDINAYTFRLQDGRIRVLLSAGDPTQLVDAGALLRPKDDGVVVETIHAGETFDGLGGVLGRYIARKYKNIIPDPDAPLSDAGRKATEKLQKRRERKMGKDQLSLDDTANHPESSRSVVDDIVEQGSRAGVVIAEEIREKVRRLAAKKYPPRR